MSIPVVTAQHAVDRDWILLTEEAFYGDEELRHFQDSLMFLTSRPVIHFFFLDSIPVVFNGTSEE